MTGQELRNITRAYENAHLAGDGEFNQKCRSWLQQRLDVSGAFLTPSCTAALEMSALLLQLMPGDEIIMPSYTFVSTANAFVLRGAVPVFVDVRPDTLNLDERLVEQAITPRTRAICVVHYAGVAADMDPIMTIAARHQLAVVEDAAQGLMASYKDRPLGSIGDIGAVSFHETKNVISGEGGAILLRDDHWVERAEIIREKGTNRSRFFRGQVDKYTWVDIGSSYLPGEVVAAFLSAQLDAATYITERRLAIWNSYFEWAESHELAGRLRRPIVPNYARHNAHMFYLLLPSLAARSRFIESMDMMGVNTVFHYVPLHNSPKGQATCRVHGELTVTEQLSERLVRLPVWVGIDEHLDRIFECADAALGECE